MFIDKIVAKDGKVFHTVQRAVYFSQGYTGVERKPSIAKNETLEKKCKKTFITLVEKRKLHKPAH